jgi:succinyl-diaminopimelate desuccinylase
MGATVERAGGILGELVRFDTCNPPGNERAAAEHLGGLLEAAGFEVRVDPIESDRANLVARLRGAGARDALAFCGHLDTVPVDRAAWTRDPHGGEVENGKMYGRGTVDMKGGVAAMVAGCLALASGPRLAGDVLFLGTVGEEVDCAGARRLLEYGLGPLGALVVAEPTRLRPAIAHKGALWLEFATAGKAAHGSMPSEGYNAVAAMHRLCGRILERRIPNPVDPLLGSQTQSIGAIHGGSNVNVVPDACRLTVDIRTLPGQGHDAIVGEFQSMIDGLASDDPRFRGSIRTLTSREAVSTPGDDPFIETALAVLEEVGGCAQPPIGMTYFTDASVLQPALRVPVLVLGPGDERLAHQADEHVRVADVVLAGGYYAALTRAWLK